VSGSIKWLGIFKERCWILDIGYWISIIGTGLRDAGCQMPDIMLLPWTVDCCLWTKLDKIKMIKSVDCDYGLK
jgi:hypothetical protein